MAGQPLGTFNPQPFNYTLEYYMDGSEYWDDDYDFQCYFLYQHRAELYRWIDLRCEQMVAGMLGIVTSCHFIRNFSIDFWDLS